MSKLRIEQRKNEPADLFAIRAFVQAMPEMGDDALRAFAVYAWERSAAELEIRRETGKSGAMDG